MSSRKEYFPSPYMQNNEVSSGWNVKTSTKKPKFNFKPLVLTEEEVRVLQPHSTSNKSKFTLKPRLITRAELDAMEPKISKRNLEVAATQATTSKIPLKKTIFKKSALYKSHASKKSLLINMDMAEKTLLGSKGLSSLRFESSVVASIKPKKSSTKTTALAENLLLSDKKKEDSNITNSKNEIRQKIKELIKKEEEDFEIYIEKHKQRIQNLKQLLKDIKKQNSCE